MHRFIKVIFRLKCASRRSLFRVHDDAWRANSPLNPILSSKRWRHRNNRHVRNAKKLRLDDTMSVCFSLPYPSFIGGVLALRRDHIEKSNGCSNSYYGWGLEDDDLEIRLELIIIMGVEDDDLDIRLEIIIMTMMMMMMMILGGRRRWSGYSG